MATLLELTLPDTTAPVWDTTTGLQSLTAGSDTLAGSLLASWGSATDAGGGTVQYNIYFRIGSAPDAFGITSAYFFRAVDGTSERIWQDLNGVALSSNAAVYIIIRASDGTNEDTNTTALSATPSSRSFPRETIKSIVASIPAVKISVST